MSNIPVLIFAAIVVAIVIGYITKINIGIFALLFAWLIGSFGMGMKPSAVMALFPVSMFFLLTFVPMFYKFVNRHGALEAVAMKLVYAFRNRIALLPFVLFFATALVSAAGSGIDAALALFMPIGFMIIATTGMSPMIAIISVAVGATTGSRFVISQGGMVCQNLVTEAGYEAEAFRYALTIFCIYLVYALATMIICYFLTKSYKHTKSAVELRKPAPLTADQKKSLWLIAIIAIVILIPVFGAFFFPQAKALAYLKKNLDFTMLAILMTVVAIFMKIGGPKDVIKSAPWNTVVLCCGVGLLVNLGKSAGMVDMLASWVSGSIAAWLVPIVMCIIAGIMSFFSSANSVVLPTLYPMVPALAAATGCSPLLLFFCIVTGATATGISPFSSGGGLALAACPEDDTEKVTTILLKIPGIQLIIAVVCTLIVSLFLK